MTELSDSIAGDSGGLFSQVMVIVREGITSGYARGSPGCILGKNASQKEW